MISELLKQFAHQMDIPECTLIEILNVTFNETAKKMYPDKNLLFDIENNRYFEISDESSGEKSISELSERKFILEVLKSLPISLYNYNPEKYPLTIKDSLPSNRNNELRIEVEYSDKSFDTFYNEAPYCGACQESPCMCSDRERTSTVYDF